MTEKTQQLQDYEMLAVSSRTGNAELFLFDLATGSAVNLTHTPGSNNRYPAFASDGATIAFTSDRDGAYDLYTMKADGTNLRQLTKNPHNTVAYLPSWTADGKSIVFGLHGEEGLICSLSTTSQELRTIGKGHDPNISPDGKLIAYTDWATEGYVLLLMNADGTNVRRLTEHQNRIGAVAPVFSPDGSKILYSDTVDGALEIFSISVTGNRPQQLTRFGKMATSAAWSPDMRWISFRLTDEAFWIDPERSKAVYAENRADKRPVWVMRADGSDAHPLEPLQYQAGIDGSRAVWRRKENR